MADVLERYIGFIPPGALQTYLAADGSWKHLDKRALNKAFSSLRAIGTGDFAEVHFGQEPAANVGSFGVHFKASPLQDPFYPNETCSLFLEFPVDLPDPGGLIEFARGIATFHPFDSGHCGYAFKHLHMTFRNQAFEEIGKLALRYVGFDISADQVRRRARGHVCNVSWLNFFGKEITAELGGGARILHDLAGVAAVQELGPGLMIQSTDLPIVGDVNRGALDAAPLRHLAAITRPVRLQIANLGPNDPDFALRWLSRFDG
jgi:hypothetical protein